MARKKKTPDVAELTTSEAPETAETVRALPQAFPGLSPAATNREVTCIGGGPSDGAWTVPEPIPQNIAAGGAIYNLSDRAAGVYVYRVP